MNKLMYLNNMVFEQYRAAQKQLKNRVFDKYVFWRKTAKVLGLSKDALRRLEWIIFYYEKAEKNASLTCRHFQIHRSVWYYWIKKFDEKNLRTLEDGSRAPRNTRQKEYTPLQYERVVKLRKSRLRYGKKKIFVLYRQAYPEDNSISEWKVQCIIEKSGLYYHAQKQAKINRKRKRSQQKKRITELKRKPKLGYLICLDTIVKHWNGRKRYILTAVDKHAKIAFARMYNNHSSLSASDFLSRLYYLLDGNIQNIQTDNGSEFQKYFEQGCRRLKLSRYYSRTRTPTDNPNCERFNRTLQEEFIAFGNMTDDVILFNQRLAEWLVEYNLHRPHQSLDYLSPIQFTQKYGKVSEMWSSNTFC